MGNSRWDDSDWRSYATSYTGKTTDHIFSSKSMDRDLNPLHVKVRESRDSEANPQSNAIIVGLDVTGSMGYVLDAMARTGLNTLATEIYDRKPVTDPHIMCMGIGDAEAGDRAPLQVTQFEADIRIAKQLEKIYLERGGGGNSYESYTLPWFFAATRTSIDCFEKRGKRGYLFTVGDEEPPARLRADDIKRVMGENVQGDILTRDLLTMVSRTYEVYHVIVEEGSHFQSFPDRVIKRWGDVLGQRVLRLSDHTKLAEVIVSAIQVNEGATADDVAASWSGETSLVVRDAIKGLQKRSVSSGKGLMRFLRR